jgi:flagellar hook-basal body complex protein FliE
MSVSAISGLLNTGNYAEIGTAAVKKNNNETFEAMFQSALKMVNETNELSNAAEEEEIKYALGMSTSTHDLQVAQQKANISLQYTVAVRNSILDSYKEIMNMQF